MTVERVPDILKRHIVIRTKGKGIGWHLKNVLGGGILRQEEKQLRKSVVESLLDDAVRLGSYGIRTGEYSMYMNTHRRGVVTGHINEEGQQLLQSFTEAIDTKESTAIVTA